MQILLRTVPALFVLTVVALTACNQPGRTPPVATPPLNPPAWIHGAWGFCGIPASPVSWQFSDHRIVLTSEGTSFDTRELEQAPQTNISETHGPTWYRFDYEIPDDQGGTFAAWNRFDLADDDSSVAWTSDLPDFPTEAIPLCRIESQ